MGVMVVARKFILLICLILMGSVFFSQAGNSYAVENATTGSFTQGSSSYYLIDYNGGQQQIIVNDNVTLTLTGWTDESKSAVKGKLDILSSNQTQDITMNVSDVLQELVVTSNESIHYRIVVSNTYKVEEVTPQNFQTQNTVITKNDNGTSIEDVKTVDEYGTVINDQGTTYYKTDESNQKVAITKEEYDSLNSAPASPGTSSTVPATSSTQVPVQAPSVGYAAHVQDIGWQDTVSNGELSGTTGQAKRMEAVKISIQNGQNLGVKYSTQVQDYGWMNYVSDGQIGGTTGQNKRLEAIKIELTGTEAVNYDIYYRLHVQKVGWLDWAKNGETAGTQGLCLRVEAMEIVLVAKGSAAPGTTDRPFLSMPSISYSTHVQNYGWMNPVKDGTIGGTTGQGLRIEAIKINLASNGGFSGGLTYSTHVQNDGWQNSVSQGEVSGTTGQEKRVEAIQINLTGEMASYFDVYYRVHIQDYGWLGWAKDGMSAGSQQLAKRIEAIQIKLVPKGQGEPVNAQDAFKQSIKIFLDPGHGGSDSGAIGGGYKEKDLNLAVTKKVQALLTQRGYTVYMSRTDDTFIPLLDRSQMANDLHANIFVSIHHNSTPSGVGTAFGIESYYYQYDPAYPLKINAGMDTNPYRIAKSMTLAGLIQGKLVSYTGGQDNGIAGETFSVIRESAMPATLLELGYINNPSEREKLVSDSYQNTEAKAIADGIDAYFH